MTLEKAIKLLNMAKEGFPTKDAEKYYVAMELGIEAADFILMSRVTTPGSVPTLLHGETQAPLPG